MEGVRMPSYTIFWKSKMKSGHRMILDTKSKKSAVKSFNARYKRGGGVPNTARVIYVMLKRKR